MIIVHYDVQLLVHHDTGRAQLIQNDLMARFSFELSRNLNEVKAFNSKFEQKFNL